jgi:SAM-dependent methyltransferase
MADPQRESNEAGREFYNANYRNLTTDLYTSIRQEVYDEHFGQTGWLTADEQDRLIARLSLSQTARVLDVACGSGGPSLRLVRATGCDIVGIDIHEQGIANATEAAAREGLAERARFERCDASERLPFPDETFDAVVCIDAINHLPDRPRVVKEWRRVLKPGGRIAFTDPITVTGPLSNEETAIRSSLGFFLFVPPGYDERVIEEAGLDLLICEDSTENTAEIAGRWFAARSAREGALRQLEGDAVYEAQQRQFEVAGRLARGRRLSRFTFIAIKPVAAT